MGYPFGLVFYFFSAGRQSPWFAAPVLDTLSIHVFAAGSENPSGDEPIISYLT
jgi:hypothetical protein